MAMNIWKIKQKQKDQKNIALIYIGNIEICPYRKIYESVCKKCGIEYDVLFWERERLSDMYPTNYKYFKLCSDVNKSKIMKLLDFLKYFFWIRRKIMSKEYGGFVFLDTISGLLGFFSSFYKYGNGILEVRDYTYEKIRPYKRVEELMINHMDMVNISSNAFHRFLPEWNYQICHNFSAEEYNREKFKRRYKGIQEGMAIRVVYSGNLKYYNYQLSIIEELKNDPDYSLTYHGIGPAYERLVKYCRENDVKNVSFTGYYTDEDKAGFYEEADIILNCYDVTIGNEILYAVSNKFYDGLIYHIPQISETGTYKGKMVEKYGIGISWRPGQGSLKEKINDYFYSIDSDKFDIVCDKLMEKYAVQLGHYEKRIKNELKGMVS